MILALLQAAGIPTRNRLQLGPTRILRAALLSGAIDLYPEYTGNAAFFFAMDGDPVWKDARAGYERAKALDLQRNNVVWLPPAPADNSWVIAMRGDFAEAHKLASLEDFAGWIRAGGAVKLAASAEFVESRSGLPAFQEAYGFSLDARQLLVLSGGNTSATIKAAADGISGVNAAMAYGSDGALTALGLRALIDTKHAQPVYAPAPVVRGSVVQALPQIGDVLAPAFASLDLETLRTLNEKIAIQGGEARARRAHLSAPPRSHRVSAVSVAPARGGLRIGHPRSRCIRACARGCRCGDLWRLSVNRAQQARRWAAALLMAAWFAGNRDRVRVRRAPARLRHLSAIQRRARACSLLPAPGSCCAILLIAGLAASAHLDPQQPARRISLGSGFWILFDHRAARGLSKPAARHSIAQNRAAAQRLSEPSPRSSSQARSIRYRLRANFMRNARLSRPSSFAMSVLSSSR